TRISGGLTGMQVPVPKVAGIDFSHTKPFYFLALGFLVAFGLFTGALRRSRTGRRLQALRDSPDGLRTLGVSLAATKLFVFAIAGAMASVGGVLLGVYQQEVGAQSFAMLVSVSYLVAVVLGGIGSVPGAVLGAFILAFPTFTQTSSGTFNNYFSLGIGLAVVQMARFPNGLISYYRSQGRSIAAFARRRREAALGTGVAVPAAAPEVVKVARRG